MVLKLADITVKGTRGGKVELELKAFLWMDLHLQFVTAAHVGHLERIRRREELRGAARSFSFSLWYRDRVLITNDQQKDSEGAFGAVEAMLFIFVALAWGKVAEHILYSGLQSYRFTMVHLCHPTGSAGGCNIVSLAPQLATRCATPSWPFSYKTLNLSLARCRSTLK